jgi:hypothetical protein
MFDCSLCHFHVTRECLVSPRFTFQPALGLNTLERLLFFHLLHEHRADPRLDQTSTNSSIILSILAALCISPFKDHNDYHGSLLP